jgi:predicted nucleic acid-binding protein
MILVDTSVWIDHFRHGNDALATQLNDAQVLCHPFIVGELACGNLRQRAEILAMLRHLPEVALAEHDEVLILVERHTLAGSGIGWLDAHLLASTMMAGASLWTLDRPLARAARRLHAATK